MTRKGFTLIELLVVVAVLALLASIVFSNLGGAREGARISNTLSFQSQTHSLLGSDLVGWWKLDDNLNDTSGYGNNGTWGGGVGPTYVDGVPGTGGKAINFNGTDDYIGGIAQTTLLEPSAITISAWINMDVNAPTARNIWLTKWYGYSCEIQADTRIPYFRLYGPGDIFSNKPLTLGRWHHFVGTYNPSIGGSVYLDSELVGSKGPSGDIVHNWNYPLNIGRYAGGVYFDGTIDDVRIYSRALTASEVQGLYAQTKGKYLAND